MRRALTSELTESPISPLVDVVFNAMAAIFVFLIIYIVIVHPVETPPLRIHTTALPDAVWHMPYEAGVAVSGGVGHYTFDVLEPLADGLCIGLHTGRIQGHPRPQPGGETKSSSFMVFVRVTDHARTEVSTSLLLTVRPYKWPFDPADHPLSLLHDAGDLSPAIVDRPYRTVLGPVGGVEPYRMTWTGDIPPGLSCDEGVLAGVPTTPGAYAFDVVLEDSEDVLGALEDRQRHTRSYRLEVHRPAALSVQDLLPRGRFGEPYQGSFTALGGLPPYEWTVVGPELPLGLSWSQTETRIEGIPEEAGEWSLALEFEDSLGTKAAHRAALRVLPARPRLEVLTSELPAVRIGSAVDLPLTHAGAVEPVRWRLAQGELPPGLSLNDGRIRGTPTDGRLGTYRLRVELRDALENTRMRDLELALRPAPVPLRFED